MTKTSGAEEKVASPFCTGDVGEAELLLALLPDRGTYMHSTQIMHTPYNLWIYTAESANESVYIDNKKLTINFNSLPTTFRFAPASGGGKKMFFQA